MCLCFTFHNSELNSLSLCKIGEELWETIAGARPPAAAATNAKRAFQSPLACFIMKVTS